MQKAKTRKKFWVLVILFFLLTTSLVRANKLLVYMDRVQNDHLRAYGVAYWVLTQGINVEWLLNYRGGSFILENSDEIKNYLNLQGVAFIEITNQEVALIYKEIEENNMVRVLLEKAPKIAVYTPPESEPWDDAVTLVLEYAKIPYDTLWDAEVLAGQLLNYDWLHLHHEDFTGQYGKFYGAYHNAAWYQKRVLAFEQSAISQGYRSVPEHKLAVAKAIKEYVNSGGFLFAMCSACDTLDIALAAEGVDIVPPEIDHTPIDPECQSKLDFSKCLAFHNFTLETNPYVYEFSDIDVDPRQFNEFTNRGDFELFEFSAKFDLTPTIFTQNHSSLIRGFLGQTTAFNRHTLKDSVIIMGKIDENMVKYIYGTHGKGTFTFLAGHDPEDFAHLVGEEPTNLSLYKNSPGYRLILNNILFPAAKKKKQKT